VTGQDIDAIHEEMHRVAVNVVQDVGDKEVGLLWTDFVNGLRTDSSS